MLMNKIQLFVLREQLADGKAINLPVPNEVAAMMLAHIDAQHDKIVQLERDAKANAAIINNLLDTLANEGLRYDIEAYK